MKNIFFLMIIFFSGYLFSKDLIIHMDINKTIIALDSKQQHDQQYVLNVILAERIYDCWDETILKPISYSEYVFTHILPNCSSKENQHQTKIKSMNALLQIMEERHHPDYENAKKQITQAKNVLNDLSYPIFPSFLSLLQVLEEKKVDYSIIFRSFGNDAPLVFESLLEHAWIDQLPRMFVMKQHVLTEGENSWKTAAEMEKELTKERFSFVQDDYLYWNNHKRVGEYGKIFPISTPTLFSIFFDDHIAKPNSTQNVIQVLSDKNISFEKLFREKKAIPVDTFEAITNENYFIQHIPLLTAPNS